MNKNKQTPLYPCLDIHLDRITENTRVITSLLGEYRIDCFGVTKVLCGIPEVGKAMLAGGCTGLADSRLENIIKLRKAGIDCRMLLLRLPMISQVELVVDYADYSLVSEIKTARALDRAAVNKHRHGVILMIDVGDLREGIWPPEEACETAYEIEALENIDLTGIGLNLACYGGIVPDEKNMARFTRVVRHVEEKIGRKLEIVSGGNSSGLNFVSKSLMPIEVNSFRVGETILLGRDVYDRSPFPGTFQNTLEVKAEIVELKTKPSVPVGTAGQDAFGNEPSFEDQGDRTRAICAIGRQDLDLDNITPLKKGAAILGGSSDHLIVDITDCDDCDEIEVGDVLSFEPSYSATLTASTSPYVQKRLIYNSDNSDKFIVM